MSTNNLQGGGGVNWNGTVLPGEENQREQKLVEQQYLVLRLRNESVPAISRLPDEVLSHIFAISSTSVDTVATVSHRWRNVALDTPRLWNHICLGSIPCDPTNLRHGNITSEEPWQRRAQRNSACVRLSKAVGLVVDIGHDADVAEVAQMVDDVYTSTSAGPTNLQELHFRNWNPDMMEMVSSMIVKCRMTLRVLRIDGPGYVDCLAVMAQHMGNLFAMEFPRLDVLVLENTPLPRSPIQVPSCRSLTLRVEITFAREGLLPLLRCCPYLEALTILRWTDWWTGDPTTAQPQGGKVVLVNLQYFNMLIDFDPAHLYPVILAPSLKTLLVRNVGEGVNHPLTEFLAHSSPRITALACLYWNTDCLKAALEYTPELESLDLSSTCESDLATLIKAMSGTHDRPLLCPRLDHLAVEMGKDSPLSLEVVDALAVFLQLRHSLANVSDICSLDLRGFPSEARKLAADVNELFWEGELLVH